MITNKRYDLNFIEDLLSLYDYKAGLRTYGIIVTPCGPNSFYQPEIMCLTDDDKYEEGGNFYINRFSIGFSGFGHRDKKQENMIYDNIVKAKQLVDTLNNYVDKCNEVEISKEQTSEIPPPPPPPAPPLRVISETLFQKEDYPYNGNQCKLCGKPVHSPIATQVVCNKCASEYKF